MTDPLGHQRYGVRVRFIEYEHQLFLMPVDFCQMFNIPYDEHVHWFIQDIPSDPEAQLNGMTNVICADDRSGAVLFHRVYEERHDAEPDTIDNNFYAYVLEYVRTVLGYDLGPLLVDIQTPQNPLEDLNGALLRIEWTTFDE